MSTQSVYTTHPETIPTLTLYLKPRCIDSVFSFTKQDPPANHRGLHVVYKKGEKSTSFYQAPRVHSLPYESGPQDKSAQYTPLTRAEQVTIADAVGKCFLHSAAGQMIHELPIAGLPDLDQQRESDLDSVSTLWTNSHPGLKSIESTGITAQSLLNILDQTRNDKGCPWGYQDDDWEAISHALSVPYVIKTCFITNWQGDVMSDVIFEQDFPEMFQALMLADKDGSAGLDESPVSATIAENRDENGVTYRGTEIVVTAL